MFVTHDQEEALTLSDRIAVFNDGRIEQVARPSSSTSARDPFVAGFVGTSNLLEEDGRASVLGGRELVSIRPEKIHLHAGTRRRAGTGASRRHGRRRRLPRLRHALVVDLDAGARLSVMQQNLESSLDHASVARGEQVRLCWARAHVVTSGATDAARAAGDRSSHGGEP